MSIHPAMRPVRRMVQCEGIVSLAMPCINFVLAPDIWILNKFIGTPIETDCLSICAVLAKYFIYCCKVKDRLPNIMSFKQKLKSYKSVELYSKFMY